MSSEIIDLNSYYRVAEGERTNEARSKSKYGNGGGSWLVAIAEVMGKMADRMGKDLVEMAKKIDNEMAEKARIEKAGGVYDGDITELNAKLQANTQLLNMFIQTMNTVIKTIGEGNGQLSRKQ